MNLDITPELPEKLLSLGGKKIDDTDLGWPECYGKIMDGNLFDTKDCRLVLVPMAAKHCHDNVAILWNDVPGLEVWSGFALHSTGIWSSHSWCVEISTGAVIETTAPFKKYFGVLLDNNF